MLRSKIVLLWLACGLLWAFVPVKPAYRLFTGQGKEVPYDELVKRLKGADVVLFGELHNNPICHWLELEISKDLHRGKGNKLVLGAEMFEADDQLVLDEYLRGMMNGQQFQNEAKVWRNFETDYKPLLDFAKGNRIAFVATNVPRRYASLVSKSDLGALGSLPREARQWIAPLPIEVDLTLPGYKNMLTVVEGHGHGNANGASLESFAKAQAVKDATMAHFILKNCSIGQTFLHFNGAYHSQNYEGIVWYLKKQNPDLRIVTIHSLEQEDLSSLDPSGQGTADFVLAVPSAMTKTH
jgi:uncharacterized iron-regulated protein